MNTKKKWFEVIPQKGGYLLRCYKSQELVLANFFWSCLSGNWAKAKSAAFYYGDQFMYGDGGAIKK